MSLPKKTFQQFVSDFVTAWAAELGLSPALTEGDPLRAIMESVAAQALFLQYLAIAVNKYARAGTAEGEDLDTWVADYDLERLPAIAAEGTLKLSVLQAKNTNVVVVPGPQIQIQGGSIVYEIIADSNRSAWSESDNAYVLTASSLSIEVTVRALVAGTKGNVQLGQLNQMVSPIVGIDAVTNEAPITNGIDGETDASLRNRFILYINSLSKATRSAILAAASNIRQGLNLSAIENIDQSGDERLGSFVTVVDDGSGNPSSELIDQIKDAIEPVRGFTIQQFVIAATKIIAAIALNIKVKDGANENAARSNAQKAVISYVNSLKIGESLFLYKLIQIAIDADPNILSVQPDSVEINDAEEDLTASAFEVIRTSAEHVVIGSY